MPITVILDMTIHQELLDEFLEGLAASMPGTLGFDGCEYVKTHQDAANPNRVVLIEGWASDEVFASYGAWRADRGDAARYTKYYDGAPQLTKLIATPGF